MSRKSGSSVASIKRYFEPSAAEGSVQLPVGLSFGINPTILLDLFWILQALGRKSLAKGEVNRITTSSVWYCTSAICDASAATSLSTVNRAAKNWNAQDFKASKIYRTLTGPDWLTKWLYGMLSKRSIADVNSAGTGFVFNTVMQANPFLFALHIHEQRSWSLLSRSGD